MKILVCVKHVPDTEAKVKIGADGRSFDDSGVKMIPSPYDEFALEEALLLRDAGGGEVVAAGTPEDVVKMKRSYTGQFLEHVLSRREAKRRKRIEAAE